MVKVWVAAVAVALVATAPAGAAPVTTTAGETRRVELQGSGTVGMVSYAVTHEFNERVQRPARLPGVKVERDGAFAGAFGDSALLGAWMAPPRVRQFAPEADLLESARLHTRFDTDAVPLTAGDRFGMAFAHVPFDAPIDPERDRATTAAGEIAWDHAVDFRRVTGRHGGRESSSDAIFVRGDVVARGGDVDARGGNMRVPPLVIDLPKVYPAQTEAAFAFSIALPSTVHLAGIDVKIVPTTGKAVIRTNLVGYVPEAREFTAPGGAQIKEWHLPITGAIMLSDEDSPLSAQPSVTLPKGGMAVVGGTGRATEVLRARSGQRATPDGLTSPRRARRGERADTGAAGTGATDELVAAAGLTAERLTAPRAITLGDGAYELTLDPDFRDSGALAVTGLRRGATGTPFLDALSIPFVRIDGEAVPLRSADLTDVRVLPIQRIATITQTGWGIGADSRPAEGVRTNRTNPYGPGMLIDLVYGLSGGREVYVHVRNGGDPLRPLDIVANATVRDRAGAILAEASPILHVELPAGRVSLGGEEREDEFTAPLDEGAGALGVGGRSFFGTVAAAGRSGRVTVTRAGGAPEADPRVRKRPFGRSAVAIHYAPDGGERGYLTTRVGLEGDGTAPIADPPPLGTFCGARVVDEPEPEPEAPGGLDIRAMQVDEDAANVYVTLVLGAPAAVQAGRQSWMGHFRTGNQGHFVRANLETDGTWSFFQGPNNVEFGGPTYFLQYATGGEAAGNLIRIAVPRSTLASTLLRDTSARSYLYTPAAARSMDIAPDGSSQVFGFGGSYRLGACR